jgi:competence protein ComEA
MQIIIFKLLMLFVLGMVLTPLSYAGNHHAVVPVKTEAKAPVNINKADVKTLTTLKGIGIKKAQAIINYRQAHGDFKSLQDLAMVKGIGEKALARIIKNNPSRLILN